MNKRRLASLITSFIITGGVLSGCGTTTNIPDLNLSSDGTLSQVNFAQKAEEALAKLKESNPELAKELEALKSLKPEEVATKMNELKAKYPELANIPAPGKMHGGPGGRGHGFGKGGPGGFPLEQFAKDNENFAKDLQALKNEHKSDIDSLIAKYPDIKAKFDEQKAKMEEMEQKHLDELKTRHPEFAADIDAIKALSGEERMAKMKELMEKLPKPQQGQKGGIGKGLKKVKPHGAPPPAPANTENTSS